MNLLTAAWRKLTYRNDYSCPDPGFGLHINADSWGGRTVHDPRVPGYLDARRTRLLREGWDSIDLALLDPDTLALLHATAGGRRRATRHLARVGS